MAVAIEFSYRTASFPLSDGLYSTGERDVETADGVGMSDFFTIKPS